MSADMTAFGKIKEISGTKALVSVVREGACGGNCASCSGCENRTVDVTAYCDIPVEIGELVEIASRSGYIYFGMIVVFLLPVIFPLLGYFMLSGISVTAACIAAVILFVLSLIIIFCLSKSKQYAAKTMPYVLRVVFRD